MLLPVYDVKNKSGILTAIVDKWRSRCFYVKKKIHLLSHGTLQLLKIKKLVTRFWLVAWFEFLSITYNGTNLSLKQNLAFLFSNSWQAHFQNLENGNRGKNLDLPEETKVISKLYCSCWWFTYECWLILIL